MQIPSNRGDPLPCSWGSHFPITSILEGLIAFVLASESSENPLSLTQAPDVLGPQPDGPKEGNQAGEARGQSNGPRNPDWMSPPRAAGGHVARCDGAGRLKNK